MVAGRQACAPACICRAKFYPLGKMLVAVKKLAQTSSRISRRETLLVSEGRRRDKDKPSWGRHREEALSPLSATVLSTYDIYSLTFNAKRTSADDNLSLSFHSLSYSSSQRALHRPQKFNTILLPTSHSAKSALARPLFLSLLFIYFWQLCFGL